MESSNQKFTQTFSSWLEASKIIIKHLIAANDACLGRQGVKFGRKTTTDHSFNISNNLLLYYSQVSFLRKKYGSRLNVFAPVNDLSSLSKSSSSTRSLLPGKKNDVAISGGQILGDEYSDHVVKVLIYISCS